VAHERLRLIEKRPKVLLQDHSDYRLEHAARAKLDEKYGEHETTIGVSKLLKELPGKVADEAERIFLKEAISCYHHKNFLAAIIMAWNLTYDHLLRWIIAGSARMAAFQSNMAGRIGPKKAAAVTITNRESFEDFKESETLDICGGAGLFASFRATTAREWTFSETREFPLDPPNPLSTQRNMAAHPTLQEIGAAQAGDAITSLVQNVVLVLQ
jgi:hypothetical protein